MLLKYWLLLFLIVSSYKRVSAENVELISSSHINLEDEQVKNFFLEIKKFCSSKHLLTSITSHKSYPSFGTKKNWSRVCKKTNDIKINKKLIINFFKNNFKTKKISSKKGLLTAYYEPTINVSWEKNSSYKYPILKNKKKFMGMPREKIEKNYQLEDVLMWTDDYVDFFFLQIQGSGIGILPDNTRIKINYDGNNKIKYTSIGKIMTKNKIIDHEKISLFTIKDWLRKNKTKVKEMLNQNKRYIFFKSNQKIKGHSIGAFGKELVPKVSIAIDKKIYPYAVPFLLQTNNKKYNLLTISSDTGSAIKGPNRVDLFAGRGQKAEKFAGNLKKKLLLFILIPNNKKNE